MATACLSVTIPKGRPGNVTSGLPEKKVRSEMCIRDSLLIVTEAPIDLMSHASIAADFYGRDWTEDHRISTGCLWNGAIDRYLEGHPQVRRVVFAVEYEVLALDKDGGFR